MTRFAFHDLLGSTASLTPAAPALSYKQLTFDYAAIHRSVGLVAADLQDAGLQRGDRVAIYLEKRPELVIAMFATSAAGGVFVPVNHVLKPPQVEHILTDCSARVLVTSRERLGQLGDVPARCGVEQVVVVGDGTNAVDGDRADGVRIREWVADRAHDDVHKDDRLQVRPGVDLDPAAILYTSGSTGRPKGVVLSHRNLIVGAESVSSYLGNTSDDVILSVLPLSFDAGLSQVTTAFAVGAHCVLMNYLLPAEVPKLCERHGVTGLTCVPPLWLQLAQVPWPAQTAHRLRYMANTGGRMPRHLLDRLRSVFSAADPYLMYGLTEAFRSTYLHPAQVDLRPDSIGKAIPNAEVLVLRPDGTECAPGEEGELVHRGPLVALGYWNDPERTAERFRPIRRPGQDWRAPEFAVWSGDTVVADAEGYLYFVGRADDMIKTSGYRVSPTEIEEAVYATGLVRDAVAFGVADDALGQRILLVLTPSARDFDVDDLLVLLRRRLPAYMVPRQVEVRTELPRSPNGKFDRTLIRSEAGERA